MSEPARARAVLSTEDLTLLRQALVFYLEAIKDQPESGQIRPALPSLG